LALAIIILVVIISVEFFPHLFIRPASFNIEIDDGATTKSIAFALKQKGFIIDPYGFSFFVYITGGEGKLKSGVYKLENISNTFGLINELKKGGLPKEITVTIPEGYAVTDISKKLFEAHVINDEGSFVKEAHKFEGYLFPDTYRFFIGSSNSQVIDKMKARFYEVLPADFAARAKSKGLSESNAIVLASIIEREVYLDKDRPLAVSVFLNRLKIGMPLQADSTIFYILPSPKESLSADDFKIDSPYNTYKYAGLPPAPISNPGLKSIEAITNAPETPYYYFITKPDGEAIFEKTLEEHNRDIAKYYGN
jgi:UPF0755 protein